MDYLPTIELVQNDTLPDIRFTLRDSMEAAGSYLDSRDPSTWKPIDITNKRVYMRIRELGSKETLNEYELIPLDSAAGEVLLRLPCDPKAFPNVGIFEGEVRIENDEDCGEQTVTERFKFKVIEEFV